MTGELRAPVYVGSFVPNTGDPYNGMVTNEEWPTYGVGFRVSQGIQPEGRVGLAWDITGSGKTSLHASLGRYHNAFVNANGLDVLARQPPAQNNPVLRYATIALLQTPEARAAFDTTPSNITGFQHVAPTPKSLNYSIGVQRELGWGTVLDVTYAGSKTENIEVTYQYNDLPYGTNFIDVHPENIDPRTGGVLPANFLRPYRGYGTLGVRQNTGDTDYNSMQVQLNRRYISGFQFALAYTLAKGYDTTGHQSVCRGGSGLVLARTDRRHPAAQPDDELHLGRAGRQPAVEQLADPRRARRLAALRQHGLRLRRLVGRDLLDHR